MQSITIINKNDNKNLKNFSPHIRKVTRMQSKCPIIPDLALICLILFKMLPNIIQCCIPFDNQLLND